MYKYDNISLISAQNENVLEKIAEKIKPHILCPKTLFFRKSCRLCDNIEKYIDPNRSQMTI